MKTSITDPWSNGTNVSKNCDDCEINEARFEDSFVNEMSEISRDHSSRLSDSEQYLARLYSRLKHVKGGTSKKDLVNSLSEVKEDCIARLVTNGQRFESEDEALLAANPVIRHIAPHLQALTASELIHLLKADVLQTVTDEQNGHKSEEKNDTDETKKESFRSEQFEEENILKSNEENDEETIKNANVEQ